MKSNHKYANDSQLCCFLIHFVYSCILSCFSKPQHFLFTGAFRIDPTLGIIYSNGTIDREIVPFYNLTVVAYDGGFPINSAEVQVIISVLDTNDNSPTFSNKTYYFEIYENVPIGYVISQVSVFLFHF